VPDFFHPWPKVLGPLAQVLRCMSDPPNLRASPGPGDVDGPYEFWFDGGAGINITGGGTRYVFTDGGEAWVTSGLPNAGRPAAFTASVTLAGGLHLSITQEP
jgi:hypothetical protein